MHENYMCGFGSYLETEAKKGALPLGRNSPQRPPLGLYAEQINGSAFTCPRASNFRSWLYRIKPSVVASPFEPISQSNWLSQVSSNTSPSQYRWDALSLNIENANIDFFDGIQTWAVTGQQGCGGATHLYAINTSMKSNNRFLQISDGELVILVQEGDLEVLTEFGVLNLKSGDIGVIPRGVKFQVNLQGKLAKGYAVENFGSPFKLPDLGPIGANGLANPRDFYYPKAHYFNETGNFETINKFDGHFWRSETNYHPLNVVAWHGNYAPYQYNLRDFNTIGTISFDHPDPSIFTVLTSPSSVPGVANMDFVIFPERWLVGEDTFRPPYYHKNIMSELMGLLYGQYDAKPDGFNPGGVSIHNMMTPHGPDTLAFQAASDRALKPEHLTQTMAFMFESSQIWKPTQQALKAPTLQKRYIDCWQDLPSLFK